MFLMARSGHSDRSLAFATCVRESFQALGWKHEYVAHLMRMAPAQLSRKLAAIEPLSVWDLADLPEDFHREYDKRRVGLRGAVVLEAPDLTLIRGACALGARRMARMIAPRPVEQPERRQA